MIQVICTRYGKLGLKVSEGAFGPAQVKAEFDACARAAAEHGVPVRVVIAEVLRVHGADDEH